MHSELKQVADLALFAKIVETGGITRCAEELGMERTTISRRLGSLERELGVKLLDRTPKHISVTDAGQRCLEQCELLLESARNAQSLAMVGALLTNQSPIVVGASPDLMDRFLERYFHVFERDNRGIAIERRPVSAWHDDALGAVDIGIALAPVTGAWTNRIGALPQSVYASVEYASEHAPVRTPHDLANLDSIIEAAERECVSWRFGHTERSTTVTVRRKHVVSGVLEAREAALAGLGIARLPQYLVDLVPETQSAARDIIAISPQRRQRKNGCAALRTFLESAFRKMPGGRVQ
jgi:DNA-binding transcriptional LysR family regulator